VRTDPRTPFPHTDGICAYILEYARGLRCVVIDDTWTGPAREGCPADLRIQWRIEGTEGLAIGDLGWCKEPHTTPSTLRYARKGDRDFHRPVWTESWFPDAFIGTMAELLVALETGQPPSLSGADNLKTMAMVDAAYASAAEGRPVAPADIPLKATLRQPLSLVDRAGLTAGLFAATHGGTPVPTEILDLHQLTPRAQQAVRLAREEARRLCHYFVGTEHLLLGLVVLGQGSALTVLQARGIAPEAVRQAIEQEVAPGPRQPMSGTIPLTPRTKKVIGLAAREAESLRQSHVGTEHLLLALLLDGDGIAARVLQRLGLTLDPARREILGTGGADAGPGA
jgi:hypothetical protein